MNKKSFLNIYFKNKFFLLINLFFLTIFSSADKALSKCNFNASTFLEEINDPKKIKNIEIVIPNNRKYVSNTMKALITRGNVIPKKLKKKYKANVNVNYSFGECEYKAKVIQHGDLKDHIKYENYEFISSMSVKLLSGNILNSVRFILFIPETRKGLNEILGSVIYKNLNFLSPETFEVPVIFNNKESIMLFQEKASKEMLERKKRREGPIFEGDESLLITDTDRNMNFKMEDLLLSRMTNKNWFLKNNSSQYISIYAYKKLQKSFLNYADSLVGKKREYLKYSYKAPTKKSQDKFLDYNFLTLSMNGFHGLIPHNRKFFFNSIEDKFEPIYYDGNLALNNDLTKDIKKISKNMFSKNYIFRNKNKFTDAIFIKKLEDDFSKRVLIFDKNKKEFFYKSISNINRNMENLQTIVRTQKIQKNNDSSKSNQIENYILRSKKKNINQDFIRSYKINENGFLVNFHKNGVKQINNTDLMNVLANMKIGKNRIIFLADNQTKAEKYNKSSINFEGFAANIISSKNIKTRINIQEKEFYISSNSPREWILIKDAYVGDWSIFFNENQLKNDNIKNSSRFNKRGLTGCLNFYKTKFSNTNIDVNNSSCEDGLNIMNSEGNLNRLEIKNASSDGVDLDFSVIKLNQINVSNSGNDCLDVSGGKYFLKDGFFKNCSDKAFSIGEKSNVDIDNIKIESSNIAVSVKDYSTVKIKSISSNNTNICIEAKQKKQEFGGARAIILNNDCQSALINDENSSIKFITNEL